MSAGTQFQLGLGRMWLVRRALRSAPPISRRSNLARPPYGPLRRLKPAGAHFAVLGSLTLGSREGRNLSSGLIAAAATPHPTHPMSRCGGQKKLSPQPPRVKAAAEGYRARDCAKT